MLSDWHSRPYNIECLDVSMNGLDILLFINSLHYYIFDKSSLVLLNLLQLREQPPLSFKHLHLLKAPVLPLKIK